MLPLKKACAALLVAASFSPALLGQQKPAESAAVRGMEFPVLLQSGVTAGKTPAGTRIEARLTVSSLVNGIVVPRNAVFSGEVIESVAKTETAPSRLAIRMDSVKWKKGSAALKVYLTAWYYPTSFEEGQSLQYGPPQSARRGWNGAGEYPDPNSPAYKPFPGGDSEKNSPVPDTPSSTTSSHRIPIKNVEAARADDGVLTLLSHHSSIKLDKITTYILEFSEATPAK